MANLRKVLVAGMSAAMVLGTMGLASAQTSTATASTSATTFGTVSYKDVTTSTPDYQAIVELSALGLVNGFPDGTYQPLAPVTRAEFTKLLVTALGYGQTAQLSSGAPTQFKDVPANAWYTGYVAVAAARGIVNGVSKTQFAPNAPVTFAQAVTMLVRALGYGPLVSGPYPWGYLTEANAIPNVNGQPELLAGLSGVTNANAPLNRANAAQLIDNALYSQTATVTTTTNGQQETVEGATLLTKLGYNASFPGATQFAPPVSDTDIVTATPSVSGTLAPNQLYIGTAQASAPNYGVLGQLYTLASNYGLIGASDINGLLGYQVSYVSSAFGNQIKFLDVVTPSGSVLTGTVASNLTGTTLYVTPTGSNSPLGIGLAPMAPVVVSTSGSSVLSQPLFAPLLVKGNQIPPISSGSPSAPLGTNLVAQGDSVTVIRDSNGNAIAILDSSAGAGILGVVTGTSTDASNGEFQIVFSYVDTSTNTVASATYDIAPNATITLNGSPASASQLAANDVVVVYPSTPAQSSPSGAPIASSVQASSRQIVGTVTGQQYNGGMQQVEINNQWYNVDSNAVIQATSGATTDGIPNATPPNSSMDGTIGQLLGTQVRATLDASGNVAFATAQANLVLGVAGAPVTGGVEIWQTNGSQAVYQDAPNAPVVPPTAGSVVVLSLNPSNQVLSATQMGSANSTVAGYTYADGTWTARAVPSGLVLVNTATQTQVFVPSNAAVLTETGSSGSTQSPLVVSVSSEASLASAASAVSNTNHQVQATVVYTSTSSTNVAQLVVTPVPTGTTGQTTALVLSVGIAANGSYSVTVNAEGTTETLSTQSLTVGSVTLAAGNVYDLSLAGTTITGAWQVTNSNPDPGGAAFTPLYEVTTSTPPTLTTAFGQPAITTTYNGTAVTVLLTSSTGYLSTSQSTVNEQNDTIYMAQVQGNLYQAYYVVGQ